MIAPQAWQLSQASLGQPCSSSILSGIEPSATDATVESAQPIFDMLLYRRDGLSALRKLQVDERLAFDMSKPSCQGL